MNFFKDIRELFAAIREFWAVYCGKQTNESDDESGDHYLDERLLEVLGPISPEELEAAQPDTETMVDQPATESPPIMSPLTARFAGIEDPEWTESELDSWLETLEDGYKSQVLNNVRRHKLRNGSDRGLILGLCAARRKIEQFQAKARAEGKQQSGGTGLLHLWYVWQEESRKMEQQEFFTRENRKARGCPTSIRN